VNHIDCSVRNHEHECLPNNRCELLGPLQADDCNTFAPHARPPSPTCNTNPCSLAQKPEEMKGTAGRPALLYRLQPSGASAYA